MQIVVMGPTYTSREMGEIDVKSFRSKTIYRYRQDIFPNPDDFGISITSVTPEIVKIDGSVYTHRLKLIIVFDEKTTAEKLNRYKEAVEAKTRRFDIVRPSWLAKKPEPKAEKQAEPKKTQEKKPAADKPKRGRKKKSE